VLAYFEFKKQEYDQKRQRYLKILDSCIGPENIMIVCDTRSWMAKQTS